MFAQIIRDMYVPPEILRELTDDQKEVLHYEIRREQVRRYNIWQQELEKQDVLQTKKTPVNVSKPEKHVSFVEDSKLSVIIEDAKKAFSDVSVLIVRDGNVISPTLPGCRSSPSGRDFTDGVIDDKHVTPTSSSSANPSTSFPMSSAMDFNSTTIDINLRRLSQLDGIPKSERLSLVSHNEESSRQVPTTDGESNGASIKVQEVVRVLGTDNSSTSLSRAPERPPTRSQDYLQDSYSRDQSSETEDLASSGAPELPEISPMCSSAPKAANIPDDWRPLASSANSVGLSRFSPTVSSGSAVVKGPEKSSPPVNSPMNGLSESSSTVAPVARITKDADQMFENMNLRNSHTPEQFSESDEISTTSDCDVEPSKPLKTLRLRERDSHSPDHTEVNRAERSFPNPCCFFPASNVFMFSSSSGSFKKKRSSSLGSPVLSSPKSAIATENTSRRQSTVNMMISRFESAKISTEGDKPTDKKVQQKTVRLSPEIRRRQQELFGNVGPSAVSESPVNTKSACSWFAETEAARLMNEFKLPSTVDVVNRTKNSNHDEFANVPPWFHGLLSKAAAEEMLQHANVNGSFLVRVSSSFPGYVISGLWAYRCHHTPVSVVGKSSGNHSSSSRQSDVAPTYQLYGLTNSIQFQSLQELIGYYSSHPLSSSTDHLLWHPVDQPPSKSGLPDYFSLFYPSCVTDRL